VANKKIFKPENIVNSTGGPRKSVLEELNLPPQAEEFLRVWHKPLLGLLVGIIVLVLGFSFGKQYTSSRTEQAASQLAQAMQLSDHAARREALAQVAASYRRTGAGIWSRIELAHIERDSGDLAAAAAAYEELLGSMAKRDPRSPMVRLNLAQVLAELGEYERAGGHYRQLATTQGFEAWGLLGSGELLARQGDEEAARRHYQQVVELTSAPPLLLEQAEQRLGN